MCQYWMSWMCQYWHHKWASIGTNQSEGTDTHQSANSCTHHSAHAGTLQFANTGTLQCANTGTHHGAGMGTHPCAPSDTILACDTPLPCCMYCVQLDSQKYISKQLRKFNLLSKRHENNECIGKVNLKLTGIWSYDDHTRIHHSFEPFFLLPKVGWDSKINSSKQHYFLIRKGKKSESVGFHQNGPICTFQDCKISMWRWMDKVNWGRG